MAIENSNFRDQALAASRLVAENGKAVRLKRLFPAEPGQTNHDPVTIPVLFHAVLIPQGLSAALQRLPEEISGKNRALITIDKTDSGFMLKGEGFVYDDGKGIRLSAGGEIEKDPASEMQEPLIFPGDSFEFAEKTIKILNVDTLNPDGQYPILFDCLTT